MTECWFSFFSPPFNVMKGRQTIETYLRNQDATLSNHLAQQIIDKTTSTSPVRTAQYRGMCCAMPKRGNDMERDK